MKYALLLKNDISKYEAYLSYLTREEMMAPSVQFMGAFDEQNVLCGVAAFTAQKDALLLGVHVAEGKERQGIGSKLIEAIYDLLRRNGGEQIISFIDSDDKDNLEYKEFLWKCGMNPGEIYSSGEVDIKAVLNNPIFEKAKAAAKHYPSVVALGDIPQRLFIQQWEHNSKNSNTYFPKIDLNNIDHDISTVLYDDNRVKGWVLLRKDDDGISVEHVLISDALVDKAMIVLMFQQSFERLVAKYPNEKYIKAVFQNDVSMNIFTKIFGESAKLEGQMMYYMNFNRLPENLEMEGIDSASTFVSEIDENSEDEIDEASEVAIADAEGVDETKSGSFSEDPVFEIVSNRIMVCRNCIYCVYGRVTSCHKYDLKPEDVRNGVNNCPYHHA